jgi:uncharacterized protein with LGFP repeats
MATEVGSEGRTVEAPTGAVRIEGEIFAKWRALADEMTPDGDDVQAHLGPPLGPETAVLAREGGGTQQLFRRGLIVARADGRAYVVYGAIYDRYLELGGTASALGPPISDEEGAAGGRVGHFQNGDIYWREDFGHRVVQGLHRRRYAGGGDPFRRTWVDRGAALYRSLRRAVTRLRSHRA